MVKFPLLISLFIPAILSSCGDPQGLIPSHPGPEDLAVLRVGSRKALVTATADRYLGHSPNGEMQWHLHGSPDGFKKLDHKSDKLGPDFNPNGLCVVRRGDSQLIYVANGPGKTNKGFMGSVEVFRFEEDHLVHLGSLGSSPLGARPNGIVASPDGTVYVTWINLPPKFWLRPDRVSTMEDRDMRTQSSIYAFKPRGGSLTDGTWSRVAKGIDGANGLALSDDGRTLMVASYHRKAILAFDRDPETGALVGGPRTLLDGFRFFPDNLKGLGGDHFTVCGQKSRTAFLLNSFLSLKICSGGAEEFSLKNGTVTSRRDLTDLLKGDRLAPSTFVRIGDTGYVAHVVSAGVTRISRIDSPDRPRW